MLVFHLLFNISLNIIKIIVESNNVYHVDPDNDYNNSFSTPYYFHPGSRCRVGDLYLTGFIIYLTSSAISSILIEDFLNTTSDYAQSIIAGQILIMFRKETFINQDYIGCQAILNPAKIGRAHV